MGHSSIRLKVRRRKVAQLAAYSRQHTVRNCTIPKKVSNEEIYQVPWDSITTKLTRFNVGNNICGKYYVKKETKDKKGNVTDIELTPLTYKWKNPKQGYPQPKSLHKKGLKHVYNHETRKDEYVHVKSNFPDSHAYEKKLWKNLGKAAKMKAYEDEKMKKWERKHPKPCPGDDLFKDEMIPAWEQEREQALIRIRDFVVSMFDKLPLTGRYKESDDKFVEKPVTELKDIDGDGHRVGYLDEKKSKLLKKAQEITNKEKKKNPKLVCTNLRDHKRKQGRIVLPKAA